MVDLVGTCPKDFFCRRGDAVACTVDTPIPGFRGLRTRWWDRDKEKPFPDWKSAGLLIPKRKKVADIPLLESREASQLR